MITTRRSLITGLFGLVAAPAIVRATSIMPVKAWHEDVLFKCTERHLPMRVLGLAQLKQEGMPAAFDQWDDRAYWEVQLS